MKKLLFILGLAAIIFACDRTSSGQKSRDGIYGGTVRLNEIEYFKSLFPTAISELSNYHVATQVYEGLVRYNSDLTIIPAIARSWDISEDLSKYTFHLRPNVFFHNDLCFPDTIGRAVKASDVKFCFEILCSRSVNNSQFESTFRDRVEGANEYYQSSISGKERNLQGVSLPDDSTVEIQLTHPDANFLNILTMPGCFIYPKEAYLHYGNEMRTRCVGTGPFHQAYLQDGQELILTKNERYWGRDSQGRQLPYLDSIVWTFIGDKKTEVNKFREGRLDMIYRIPVEMFHDVFGTTAERKKDIPFELYASPALSTNYYGFNLQTNPFFSIREIRQAFNLAVDRDKIADYTIKGEGQPAKYGIVPYNPAFEKKGYNYKNLRGFVYNPDSARKLLALVGYEKGKGLPPFSLELNSGGGERNLMVAIEVVKMLEKNLGVKVNMSIVNWPEHVENVQTGKTDFFRYAWVSDYADPESFLSLFYGKYVPENYVERSYVNLTRFRDRRYDSLFLAAQSQPDERKRYQLYSMAEEIILEEAAFMPLFYDENLRLVQKKVRNLEENSLNYIDLRTTYIDRSRPLRNH
jgi:peptide/nickel transport system substrate-binding protein